MKNHYKLFIKKAILFIVIFIFADFIFGMVVSNAFFKQKSGKYARIIYSIKNVDSDILIFGSSMAVNHFIPKQFEEELGQTCYNAGVLGQSLIFHSAIQKIILERTKPKLIIFNIDYRWMYESQNSYDRLNDLHPYYWEYRSILKPILSLDSKFVDFKLLFKSYQTNSTHLHMIYYYFFPQVDLSGFRPLKGTMKTDDIKEKIKSKPGKIDKNLEKIYTDFITLTKEKDIKLILTVSPTPLGYDYSNNMAFLKMKEIAEIEQIPVYDYSNDERFFYNYDLFSKDGRHLNYEGAKLFTRCVIESIKEDMVQNDEFTN